jgi:hypothetical protein
VLLDDLHHAHAPVPVRIMSTYEVIGTLGWLNTYQGLTIPLMASATATFLFRQFYLTIPNEMAEAAQLDGAGPLRFCGPFSSRCRGRTSRRCSWSCSSSAGTSTCGPS